MKSAPQHLVRFASAITLGVLLAGLTNQALSRPAEAPKISVLVITGGHGFEREPFFKMFSDNASITCVAAEHNTGSASAWDRNDLTNFAAVVLYDMPAALTDAQKANVLSLFQRGTGLVVLHHALASFQAWPDYERIIGGLYPSPPKGQPAVSEKVGYQHDVEVPVSIVDKSHPITAGLQDFVVRDEIYWGFRVGSDVHPLLSTAHPKSGKPLMWTRTEGQSRIVFLQLGHDHFAFENPNYRTLLARSIAWVTVR